MKTIAALSILLILFSAGYQTLVQSQETSIPSVTSDDYDCTIPYRDEINIRDPDHPLVIESKERLLFLGLSEEYFNDHFTLLCAVDGGPSHTEIRWQYSIGEFTTVVHDTGGTSLANTLMGGFHDIENVISVNDAEQHMQSCIGPYKEPTVILGTAPPDFEPGGLYLTARSIHEERDIDVYWDVGYVDLETGNCTKIRGGSIHAPLGASNVSLVFIILGGVLVVIVAGLLFKQKRH